MIPKQKLRKGVTLLELILVVAMIAILFAAIFVAIDPARRLAETRNATRWTDVTSIADAVAKYRVDNGGTHYASVAALVPDEFTLIGTDTDSFACQDSQGNNTGNTGPYTTAADLCSAESGTGTTPDTLDDCVDLSGIGANYLASIPSDPSTGTDALTQYYISVGNTGEITVGACDSEAEDAGGSGTAPTIEVVR